MPRNEAVGKARYELETDPTKLKQGLDDAGRRIKATGAETEKAFAQQGTGAVGKFNKSIDGVVGRFNDLSKRGGLMGAIVGGAGLGVGLSAFNLVQGAVSGVLDDIGRGIELASDKAEAASRANVLFGESYHIIEKASRDAARTVGMSSGAYLAAAGNLGNLITNFGITGDAGAEMSKQLVQLAADMGSFNNASTEEVTQAMGSAFVGETEPIRRFGVMLSAADVAARAVALGLAESTKSVSQAAKVQATYSLILEQTTKAQGDFARTSDGYANSQRIQAAKTEEALTRLGEAVMPLAQELMPMLAEAGIAVVEVLTAVVGGLKSLGDAMRTANEFFKPWEREARLARETTAEWIAELKAIPGAEQLSSRHMETIARRAYEAGEGYASARDELIDYIRWQEAVAERTGPSLVGLVRNYERWSRAMADGSITAEELDRKLRAMVLNAGGLEVLADNLDILPDGLAAFVRGLQSGDEAVARFVDGWERLSRAFPGGGEQWERFIGSNLELIQKHFDKLPDHIQEAMIRAGIVVREGTDAVGSILGRAGEILRDSLAGVADMDVPVARGVRGAVHAISALGPGLREQIDSATEQLKQAREDLLWALENPKAWMDTIRRIENRIDLANRREAAAVAAGNHQKAALWGAYRQTLVGIWEGTTAQSYQSGVRITKRHGDGLAQGDDRPPSIVRQMIARMEEPMRMAIADVRAYGFRTTSAYAAGLSEADYKAVNAGKGIVKAVGNIFRASSPPTHPDNPMRDIVAWGRRTMEAYGEGMEQARGTLERQAAGVLSGITAPAPALAGWSLSASASQTVTHEHRGRVEVALSGSTIAAAREQGASWEDVGRMASAANLGDVLQAAQRSAGRTFLVPTGGIV